MLAEQELISAETRDVERLNAEPGEEAKPVGERPPEMQTPTPRSLARRERSLRTDSEEAQRILEPDDSSVVAPALLERIQADLDSASSLLDAEDTGEVTQLVQRDIETALREMIESLRKPPPSQAAGAAGGPMGRPKKAPDLITAVMELKMLASAQGRVRARTERLETLQSDQRRSWRSARSRARG